jgi:hypothetical protein
MYPGTAGYQRRKLDPRIVNVTDIRGSEDQYTLDGNGFQVVQHGWTPTKVDDSDAEIRAHVYPETVELLKQM